MSLAARSSASRCSCGLPTVLGRVPEDYEHRLLKCEAVFALVVRLKNCHRRPRRRPPSTLMASRSHRGSHTESEGRIGRESCGTEQRAATASLPRYAAAMNARVEQRARDLLAQAFPWGALVERPGQWEFVATRYWVEEGSADGESVEVVFIRDPGDTFGRVTLAELEQAVGSGELNLGDRRVRQPQAKHMHLLAEPFRDLIGWQYKKDDEWAARMRLHQSWWRTFELRVPAGPIGPQKNARRYGSMLDDAAAARGLNFLSQQALDAYRERCAHGTGGMTPWRTERNLLASQPMAINLFGHLLSDFELLAAMLDLTVGDVAEITGGEIEHQSAALGDRTAFDALVRYRHHDGQPGLLAIETKLTEDFTQKAYQWDHYLQHPAFDRAVWNTDDTTRLGDLRWSQLWRNHLLARAEAAAHPEYGDGRVLVVHHPDDPDCVANVDGYRELLAAPEQCTRLDLGRIVGALDGLIGSASEHRPWLERFERRYLELEHSEPLVQLRYCFKYENQLPPGMAV